MRVAQIDARIERVTLIHGDTWNVNPIALKRVERLFCKNERAVIRTRLRTGEALTLVPVAAILVASIRLHFLDLTLNAQTRGPTVFPCDVEVRKGEELQHYHPEPATPKPPRPAKPVPAAGLAPQIA